MLVGFAPKTTPPAATTNSKASIAQALAAKGISYSDASDPDIAKSGVDPDGSLRPVDVTPTDPADPADPAPGAPTFNDNDILTDISGDQFAIVYDIVNDKKHVIKLLEADTIKGFYKKN